METEKIVESLKHRLVSIVAMVLLFSGLPTLLNFGLTEFRLFRLAHLDISNVVEVREFTVVPDEENPRELHVTWDRCVNEYVIVEKNFELIQHFPDGSSNIIGKTETELIDFNEGCLRLQFPVLEEEWIFLNELENGEYVMLFQMNLSFNNGVSRSFLITSDEFTID